MNDRHIMDALVLVAAAACILGARLALVDSSKARIQTAVLALLLPIFSVVLCIGIYTHGVELSSGIFGFIILWGAASAGITAVAFAFGWAFVWLARELSKLFQNRR